MTFMYSDKKQIKTNKMKATIYLLLLITLIACKQEQKTDEDQPREVAIYTIEDFYNNESIGGGAWNSEGTKLLVHSNKTGIYNIYEIDVETGEQTAITNSAEESYFALGYVPNSNNILYESDQGGNEIYHIYLLQEDGTTKDLTPGEEAKANFYGFKDDDSAFYYTSNARDSRYFDLYKMNFGNWEPTLLFKNVDGLQVGELSHNEQLLALSEPITTSENKLYLLNLNTAEKTEISKSESLGEYSSQGFSNDDKFFYYTTNSDNEFSYLIKYNLETGEREAIYQADWDVWYASFSENENFRAVAINEDGKTNIKLFDKDWNEIDAPQVEGGEISSVGFTDDEKKMRMTVSSSDAPTNFFTYDLETKNLKQLTNTLNPEIERNDLVQAEVVRFKSFDGLEIPAIYYKPHQAGIENPVPALVWVHGGPGGQSRQSFNPLIQYLVNHGYAILAVNNRGSSGYGKEFYKMDDKNHGDKDLKDCIAGKDWLAEQDYIDSEKIGIIGGSYGGYMVMAALTYAPEEFDVGVNIFGVTNWLRTLKSIPPWWESFKNALYEELGDPNTADSVRLRAISPLFHAENVTKPLMVLQGANDPRVLQIESDEIVEAVKANNVPVEYVIFEDEGHGFVKKENEIEGYGKIKIFLDTYLKGSGDSQAEEEQTDTTSVE